MKTIKQSNTTASVTAGKMNSNQMINNSFGGMSATTGTSTSNTFDHRTFIKIVYGENNMLIVNSWCTCFHMMNYIKEKLQLSRDDVIDFIDFEGSVKDMPNLNNKDYAIQYLTPTTTYTVLKIELDLNTNDKRYVCLLNESKLNANMNKTINNLNTGKTMPSKDKTKQAANTRLKQQQQQPSSQALNQSMSTPNSMQSFQQASSTASASKKKGK